MFDIGTALATGTMLISGYGKASFTIAGTQYEGSLLISGARVVPVSIKAASDITVEQVAELISGLDPAPELLLVGTGQKHEFISPGLRAALKQQFLLSVDSMDTGAACRTFNIVASEGRPVAALLIAL